MSSDYLPGSIHPDFPVDCSQVLCFCIVDNSSFIRCHSPWCRRSLEQFRFSLFFLVDTKKFSNFIEAIIVVVAICRLEAKERYPRKLKALVLVPLGVYFAAGGHSAEELDMNSSQFLKINKVHRSQPVEAVTGSSVLVLFRKRWTVSATR